jgi:hypothetical protein
MQLLWIKPRQVYVMSSDEYSAFFQIAGRQENLRWSRASEYGLAFGGAYQPARVQGTRNWIKSAQDFFGNFIRHFSSFFIVLFTFFFFFFSKDELILIRFSILWFILF